MCFSFRKCDRDCIDGEFKHGIDGMGECCLSYGIIFPHLVWDLIYHISLNVFWHRVTAQSKISCDRYSLVARVFIIVWFSFRRIHFMDIDYSHMESLASCRHECDGIVYFTIFYCSPLENINRSAPL